MNILKTAAQVVMKKAVEVAPESWLPGGTPDTLLRQKHGLIGAPVSRLDGPLKVQGAATFAAEFPMEDMLYSALAYSTIAKGKITELDTQAAEAAPGVVLVMTYRNAPKLKPPPVLHDLRKSSGARRRARHAG